MRSIFFIAFLGILATVGFGYREASAGDTDGAAGMWYSQLFGDGRELRAYGEQYRPRGDGLPDFTSPQPASRGTNVRSWQQATVIVYDSTGFGSGALISADGWFLTNYHVVADAAQSAAGSGTSPVTMKVITCEVAGNLLKRRPVDQTAVLYRVDPARDLALMKMDRLPDGLSGIPCFALADSEAVLGSECYVIGSQGSGLPWAVRTGNITGIYRYPSDITDRLIYASKEEVLFERSDFTLVGSTCSISGGDSGGPLLNELGQLTGLTTGTPRNMSAGSLGLHVSLGELRQFITPIPDDHEGVPFDPWTAGVANSFKVQPTLVLFESGGQRMSGLRYVHCTASKEGQAVPIAEELFLCLRAESQPDPASDPGVLMPAGLWGMEKKGRFPFDLFVARNLGDSLLAVGYTGGDKVVNEIRIDLNDDSRADVLWNRDLSGKWRMSSAVPGSPLVASDRLDPVGTEVLDRILTAMTSGKK